MYLVHRTYSMAWCLRDTSQNLGKPEFWAENFVQNPEGVHCKFWDPHISDAVASLELGITILQCIHNISDAFMTLAMHSQY